MNFVDLIKKKRDGCKLSKEELEYFANGAARGTIPDYQLSAMLMAICINGLDDEETTMLTMAMTYSGKTLDLSGIKGVKVDKHSTGGVADTTTLVLAPLTASLGLPVVKMSGRGLGHTGGTLDKMESIPGMSVNLTMEQAVEGVNRHGIVVMGQTENLAPADKVLYALRDVTGTVESIPLIAASIMSKKLAAGADAIVLDVKCGSGAFMKNIDDAKSLAETMIKIGKGMGRRVSALITDMNQPLGMCIGNSLEVIEAIEILKGNIGGSLKEVSLELGSEMLVLGKIAANKDEALKMLNENIKNGKGLEKLRELICIQGGNQEVINDYRLFGRAKCSMEIKAERDGYISSADAYHIGKASVALGAGRLRKTDKIDLNAGVVMKCRTGDRVRAGQTIAQVFAADNDRCKEGAEIVSNAIVIGDDMPAKEKLVKGIIRDI